MPKFCTVLGWTLVERGWNAAALAIRSESFSILSTVARRDCLEIAAAARGYYVVDGFATTATVELNWGLRAAIQLGELLES